MTEKKSLNFDFLDESPKKVEEDTSVVSVKEKEDSFLNYLKEYYFNFSEFAKRHLMTGSPRYFLWAVWLVGIGSATDRMSTSSSSGWVEAWVTVLLGGILTGAIAYYVSGWFYQVRIKWSKGVDDIDTARNIYIFSTLPISVISIGSLFFNCISYGDDYFTTYSSDSSSVDTLFAVFSLVAIIYSIRISYKASIEVMKAKKSRSVVWFIVLPVIFYVLIFANAILE